MTAAKVNRQTKKAVSIPEAVPLPVSFVEQAEVCREQARDAVRLRRFRAAIGLFATAANLLRYACKSGDCDDATRLLADQRLAQIDLEMATYTELMRATERI